MSFEAGVDSRDAGGTASSKKQAGPLARRAGGPPTHPILGAKVGAAGGGKDLHGPRPRGSGGRGPPREVARGLLLGNSTERLSSQAGNSAAPLSPRTRLERRR